MYLHGNKGEEINDIFYSKEGTKPFENGLFVELVFTGLKCAIAGDKVVKGSAIAIITPKKAGEEAAALKVNFNGEASPTGEYENREKKAKEKAGKLELGANPAFAEGEVKMELESKVGVE